MNQRNRRILTFVIMSYIIFFGGISTGLGIYFGYGIKKDAWLLINGSNFSWGDEKLIILIDVPSNGGKANQIFTYEIELARW